MKNSISAVTPKEQALAAIDALIESPSQLSQIPLKEWIMDIFGGRNLCIDGVDHEIAEVCRNLLSLLDKNPSADSLVARNMLQGIISLYEVVAESPQAKAHLLRWVIETDDRKYSNRLLTDEHLLNIAAQYTLLLELDRLQAEERAIKYGKDITGPQKEAA